MAVESDRFAQLASVPPRPGCYLFRDGSGAVLYVGKSVSLRARVRSYFHGPVMGRTRDLVARVARIETIVTDTEAAARALEAELIQRHAPPFNVRREHFPYLCLTTSEPFPRLVVAARPRADSNRYFGPYASPEIVCVTLRVIQEVFHLRTDDRPPGSRPAPPPEPDAAPLSRWEYRAAVNGAVRFLEGHTAEALLALQERMDAAAAALAFEEAARLRDLWLAIRDEA
jgi:excinuclease ABC subunit C